MRRLTPWLGLAALCGSLGACAVASAPVRDPQGKLVARFASVGRFEPDGQWRVVFGKGNSVCDCEAK